MLPLTRKGLHQSTVRHAITSFTMPAMSPTMTEGGIASWKKKEGDSFSAGDVLLEIETDKATIDVEVPEDGVLGKILAPDGTKNVSVGRVIALLAEEGDDISNLEAPKEEQSSPAPKAETSAATPSSPPASQTPPEPVQEPKTHSHHPTHSKHLMPSVIRLLIEGGVANAEVIKGTGVRGMLTKGDVLAHLGRASNPFGTYKPLQKETGKAAPAKPEAPIKPLDGDAVRQLIVSGLAARFKPAPLPTTSYSFDSVIADYLPPARETSPSTAPVPSTTKDSTTVYFDGLL
ncbi:single hybrid motif-containing protein [Boletus edulis BED1]|uniref:Single hybrid motif-containing protein n=1 Tax=Boletus edulis BED1 TaxID=1328754 RepID=A0AAD4BBN7_BOLED|nr:single hybrid motif-containing protein [Boletus edulis BED1]